MKKLARWIIRHPGCAAGLTLFAGFAALNCLACIHAYSMTHFASTVARTGRPEELTSLEKMKVLVTGVRLPRPQNTADPQSVGLAFESHRFHGDDGTTYDAWYIPCRGDRGLCILFHGYGTSKSSLLPDARVWHELGYSTLLVDFRGCGGSSGNETTIGFREADDVAAACRYAKRRLFNSKPILFGRSMGAAAVLRAVDCFELQPQAVVLECPFDRLLSTVRNRFRAMGVPSFPCAELLVFWGGVQHGYSGFRHNPAEYAAHVHCPVLLMSGEQDTRVTKEQTMAVFDGLPAPKQVLLFAGVGHESCLTAFPDQWKVSLARFLKERVETE
jgi:alpha-beta hydrolase superfamily lysophospholipase